MFKVEVIADNSGEWVGNALTFPTHAEAEQYAVALAMRWLAVEKWQVIEIEENRNG